MPNPKDGASHNFTAVSHLLRARTDYRRLPRSLNISAATSGNQRLVDPAHHNIDQHAVIDRPRPDATPKPALRRQWLVRWIPEHRLPRKYGW